MEIRAIIQYGHWALAGYNKWALLNPYYIIDGKEYPGVYKAQPQLTEGVTRRIMQDERNEREIEAVEALAKLMKEINKS